MSTKVNQHDEIRALKSDLNQAKCELRLFLELIKSRTSYEGLDDYAKEINDRYKWDEYKPKKADKPLRVHQILHKSPKKDQICLVMRNNVFFTATPWYGENKETGVKSHLWIVKTLRMLAPPEEMHLTDIWCDYKIQDMQELIGWFNDYTQQSWNKS